MNAFVDQFFDVFIETQKLRGQLMDVLTDDDLTYTPGGNAPTLGALCKEMGEVEQAYINSFNTLKLEFGYHHSDEALATGVEKLKAWYSELDTTLNSTIEGMTDAEMQQLVSRPGFEIPAMVQPHVYKEALLIFYAKAQVYLQALGKSAGEQWNQWIG